MRARVRLRQRIASRRLFPSARALARTSCERLEEAIRGAADVADTRNNHAIVQIQRERLEADPPAWRVPSASRSIAARRREARPAPIDSGVSPFHLPRADLISSWVSRQGW